MITDIYMPVLPAILPLLIADSGYSCPDCSSDAAYDRTSLPVEVDKKPSCGGNITLNYSIHI